MLSRGQRLDTRDWKIGNYVHQYGAHQIYIPEGVDKDGFDSYHIDPKTLGWSTDHRDVNDTMIFTDDLVVGQTSNSENSWIGIVRLGEYYAGHSLYHYGFYIEWRSLYPEYRPLLDWIATRSRKLEVIGNIHDNRDRVEKFDLLPMFGLAQNVMKEIK